MVLLEYFKKLKKTFITIIVTFLMISGLGRLILLHILQSGNLLIYVWNFHMVLNSLIFLAISHIMKKIIVNSS